MISKIAHQTITIEELASMLEGGNFETIARVGFSVYVMVSGANLGKLVIMDNINGEGLVFDSPS